MSLGHILKDAAKIGMFGIGGAILANRPHKPHPVFPGISMMPDASAFQDPASYLTAIQQWASGQLGAIQQTQNPFGQQQSGAVPPQGTM